jgi:hypothetical protein
LHVSKTAFLRRSWLLLAIAALLWHALHPLSAPLLARAQAAAAGEPFAEVCSTLGIKRLPLAAAAVAVDAHGDHAGASTPSAPATHGDTDHCPWCRLAGGDLAPPAVTPKLLLAAATDRTPPVPPATVVPAPLHRPQHARGPPVLL